jgi:hypothetical protein
MSYLRNESISYERKSTFHVATKALSKLFLTARHRVFWRQAVVNWDDKYGPNTNEVIH